MVRLVALLMTITVVPLMLLACKLALRNVREKAIVSHFIMIIMETHKIMDIAAFVRHLTPIGVMPVGHMIYIQ